MIKKLKTTTKILFAVLCICQGKSFAQSSYCENFSANVLPSNFNSESVYRQSVSNQELKVVVNKADDGFKGMYISFNPSLNLSNLKDRTVSFDIRTDIDTRNVPYSLFVQLFASGGKIPGSYYLTVVPQPSYRTYSFSFTNPSNWSGSDFTTITGMQIVFQPPYGISSTVYLDNIKVGSSAITSPYFKSITDQTVYINSLEKKVEILQAIDGTTLNNNVTFSAKSSNPSLIPDPTIQNSVLLSNKKQNHYYFGNEKAILKFTPLQNQFGMSTITVTAISTSTIPGLSLTPSYSIFNINVSKNNSPNINQVEETKIGSNIESIIELRGIDDGNPEINQLITITGTSSNQSFLKDENIIIEYDGQSSYAKLKITPENFGNLPLRNVTVNLNLNDGGGTESGGIEMKTINLNLEIYPQIYKSPTINKIPNYLNNIYTSGFHSITLTGISDGNGGSNVASLSAVSSNQSIALDPTIDFNIGANKAVLHYNVFAIGTTVISVTASNTGAPSNSNGNSSFTTSFLLGGINPPVNGFIEPFTATSILGFAAGDPGFANWLLHSAQNTKWNAESQGDQQNITINSVTGVLTNVMNKGALYNTGYFNGVWYRPAPGSLFNFRSFPYLSVKLSSNNPAPVAIDLWDVNGRRFGLSSTQSITTTPTDYTFCYTGSPSDPAFDISKIERVLFNFGVVGHGNSYNGTITLSNLRIGDQALNTANCPIPNTQVSIDSVGTRYFLTNQSGPKTLTLTGINAGFSPINGQNNNIVTLNVQSSGSAVSGLSVSSVENGIAVISFTTSNSIGTSIISVTGIATNANQYRSKFTVNVAAIPNNIITTTITNDLMVNMPDGRKGQSIDGFGATLNGDVGGNIGNPYQNPSPNEMVEWGVRDAEMTFARMAIPPDFEPVNDNDNPYALNKGAFDYGALKVDLYKAYQAAGVKKFIGTMWSIPAWTKYNGSYQIISNAYSFVTDNTIDTSYVEEIAEFAVAYVKALKERTGIELYALDFVNEPQFNEPYASATIDKYQYKAILKVIGKRFKEEKINTLLFGAETLPAQDGSNEYLKLIQSDAEARDYLNAYAIHNYDQSGAAPSNPTWSGVLSQVRDSRSNLAVQKYYENPLTPANSVGNGGTGIPAWQTETSGYPANWSGAFNYAIAIHNGLFFGNIGGWTFWTFDDGDPNGAFGLVGGKKIKPIYYAQKHFSKYIKEGARRIPSILPSNSNVLLTSYQNPDESVAMVIINNNNTLVSLSIVGQNLPQTFQAYQSSDQIFWNNLAQQSGKVILPPKSITTLWGNLTIVSITGVSVRGNNTISTAGGTQQFTAIVSPIDATDKSITWSVINHTGNANINSSGLLTALSNGTVLVKSTSNSNPNIFGTLVVTISAVNSLTISAQNGINEISVDGGNLQLTVNINPSDAFNNSVNWSVSPAYATISGSGLLTAKIDGVVTVTAISQSNPNAKASYVVTLSNQSATEIFLTSISVSGVGGNTINVNKGTKQMIATLTPNNATDPNITWSLENTILASISGAGLITNFDNGVITVVATSVRNPNIKGTAIITITEQIIPVESINVSVNGINTNSITIDIDDSKLQFTASILPENATNKSFVFSSSNPRIAYINPNTGELTSIRNGVVTITGTSSENPAINQNIVLNVSNQIIQNLVTISGNTFIDSVRQVNEYRYVSLRSYTILGFVETTTSTFNLKLKPNNLASIEEIPTNFLLRTFKLFPTRNGVLTITASLETDTLVKTSFVVTITNQGIQTMETSFFNLDLENTSETIVGVNSSVYIGTSFEPYTVFNPNITYSISQGADVINISLVTINGQALAQIDTKKLGEAEITIEGYDNFVKTQKIYVVAADSTPINNKAFDNSYLVYPNPTNSSISIKSINQEIGASYAFINILGETLITGEVKSNIEIVNVSSLKQGIYTLSISKGDKIAHKKIIIK